MIKKSRLRTQKKKGRRVIFSLMIVIVLGVGSYQLEQHYGIITSIQEVLHSIKITFSQIGPVRGTIYDRNLKQLAVNLERVSVYARTREIDSIEETATHLGEVLALDKTKLKDQLESGVLRSWIAKDISQEKELAIKALKLPGVYLQRDEQRYYPNDSQAAYFVGSVENGIGLSGVEFYYDRLLASRKLIQQEEKQSLSNALDLVLTIDLKIQDILESLARDIARNEKADKVAAYLLESGTGEIIGGANMPGFNPNNYAKYSREQTESIFHLPCAIPEKFRLFLRDATMLLAHGADKVSPPAWSIIPGNDDLGSQLRLWEWLGMEDSTVTDFYVPTKSTKNAINPQKIVVPSTIDYGFVPESATPLSLLTTYSKLFNKGKKIHPFVVKKILDKETGVEMLLTEKENISEKTKVWSDAESERIESLFRSQAKQGVSNTYFFRDDILVTVAHGGHHRFLVNDLLFINIPAGSSDLNMLIVVQRPSLGVNGENVSPEKKSIEQLVEEKAERISVLQQISKSVADVVEPEVGDENNYQGENPLSPKLSSNIKEIENIKPASEIMPDLRGLSLRKSLRLLQGINVELKIQGTGKVIDQKPQPGTSLKGLDECMLILAKQEDIAPEKLSKKQPGKK